MQTSQAMANSRVPASRKIRVLVADDESRVRNVISRTVTALGAEVVGEAGDGRHALALFEAIRPEVVILDIDMPKLTGDQVLARILEIDSRVVVLMMSASTAGARGCLELGARGCILKSKPAEEILLRMGESWGGYVQEILAARSW